MKKRTYLGISFVIFLVMVSTFGMRVENSRPLVEHHMKNMKQNSKAPIDRSINIAEAYSGPSNSGTGHAITHKVLHSTYSASSFNGFAMARAYSGPSRKGVGHGLSDLSRKNLNPTSFKRFNQAYSGPNDSGTGH